MKSQLEQIREIDPKAAEYIENVVLPKYEGSYLPEKVEPIFLFFWELAPQGREYWFNIWKKLKDLNIRNMRLDAVNN